jgi:hypothetical protein
MKWVPLFLLCCAFVFTAEAQAGKIQDMSATIKKPITVEAKKSPLLNVVFNHTSHRGINCFTCHHVASEKMGRYVPCSTCHVQAGRSSDHLTMFSAAHNKTSAHSCYSCHNQISQKSSKYEKIFYNCRPCHVGQGQVKQMSQQ